MVGIEGLSTPHTHLTFDEVRSIAGHYGLKLSGYERVRKVFRITTCDGRVYALKPTGLSEKDLSFIQDVLLHLQAMQFPVIPFIVNPEGSLSIATGSTRFILMPWFSGREADFHRMGELMFGAKLLARLHRSGGFNLRAIPTERNLWGLWPQRFSLRYHQLFDLRQRAKKQGQTFDLLYKEAFGGFIKQAEEALKALGEAPYRELIAIEQPMAYLCHHDFSDRNLLFTIPNCSLLDFDYCISDLRLHDLANLLLRLLRHDNWRADRAQFALRVYHRQFPLTTNHLRLLHIFLSWPQDYWQVGLQYYVEQLPWSEARFIKSLQRVINGDPGRQNFLRRFPKENGICRFETRPFLNQSQCYIIVNN